MKFLLQSNKAITLILTILVSLDLIESAQASEPSSLWYSLDAFESDVGRAKTRLHSEFRFKDWDTLAYYRVSQKIYWKVNESWKAGTHLAFESGKSDTDWKNTYRLDLELNPTAIKIDSIKATLSMRNRWELRWKEGKGSEVFHRIRQHSKISWRLPDDFPLAKSFSIGNELFYETDKSAVTMNRFSPVGVELKTYLDLTAKIFYMHQTKRSGTSSDWNGTHVIGLKTKF